LEHGLFQGIGVLTAEAEPASPRSLSIVLPAYNEEPNIETAVRRAVEVGTQLAPESEVIVVNDGSSDGTAEVVEPIVMESYPRVRLVSHPTNYGFGAALRTGFARARHDLVFFTDADNQFDISELEYFLPLMPTTDVLVGFRVYRYDSVYRLIASWGYNRLVRVLFRVRIRDVDCSFKIFRREVLDKITIESDDFFVDTELIARTRKWNFRIREKGVRHYPRVAGETTVHASDIPRTLKAVAQMWQRIHYPTKRQIEASQTVERRVAEEVTEVIPATD
jgi:glycosyltransferase involved in cell wall biosynthesis